MRTSLGACLLVAMALAAAATAAAPKPVFTPPQKYYLALGDSLAYGLQPDKVGLPPSASNTGYVDVFAARMRARAPHLRVVNYGCPGELARTFIAGGCPWLAGARPLHDEFRGAQLAAALTFLRRHEGQVSPVTLNLWGNEIAELSRECGERVECVKARAPRAIAQLASRLGTILGRLRAAAPEAEIIVTGGWSDDVDHLREAGPLILTMNRAIARAATGARARFADSRPAFNPPGSLAHEKAAVCRLTFVCSQDDGHPTNAGYRAMANAVWAASGY